MGYFILGFILGALSSVAILHKHWQERFHPFRMEYELPIELY